MKIIGKFNIRGSIKITGRGLVVWGELKEGTGKAGNYISFIYNDQPLKVKISSVEWILFRSERKELPALMLAYESETRRTEMETWKIEAQPGEILES